LHWKASNEVKYHTPSLSIGFLSKKKEAPLKGKQFIFYKSGIYFATPRKHGYSPGHKLDEDKIIIFYASPGLK
jgi:hypothetical protein